MRSTLIQLSLACLLALGTACSKQGFQVIPAIVQGDAPGGMNIPPKIDLLLVEDDTGSMHEAYSTISQQLPGMLLDLERRGWDYHFATVPLTTERPLHQIVASRYDPNWGASWMAPYPGATPDTVDRVARDLFRTLTRYGGFLTLADVSNSQGGNEPGLEMVRRALKQNEPGTGFLRPDAMLAILVTSTGDDTSGVTFCTRPDGVSLPCEKAGFPEYGSFEESLDYYKGQIASLKSNPRQVRFFAAVPAGDSSNCLGGRAFQGARYQRLASAFAGGSFDVCSKPIKSILDSVAAQLQSVRVSFVTRYLFVPNEPDPETIVVRRFRGGDANSAELIPQDAENGWTFEGYLEGVHAIDFPVKMNLSSGWAIELHGAARLRGSDTAEITFKHR